MSGRGNLSFEVDAALLVELGEQLVARKSVALAELVKNAYDADATRVTIRLEEVLLEGGRIIIEDDGVGMPFSVVADHWMRIATTDKVRQETSARFRRPLTGAKGVGRFATRKLSRRLRLETRAALENGSVECTIVEFDWDRFTPGLRLADISTPYTTSVEDGRPGTTLTLEGVREAWTAAEVEAVRDDLQTLTSPFSMSVARPSSKASGLFDVTLIAPEFPEAEGSLLARFLSAAIARLDAHVDKRGRTTYKLKIRGRSREYSFEPKALLFPELGGASLEIHLFRYDREALGDTGVSVGAARRLGSTAGGVKIYQDGFRVFPYGDPGDDWLSLDADRGRRLTAPDSILQNYLPDTDSSRALLQLPGNNNLFGAVYVSRQAHPGLRPTISRERLVDTDAFRQLTRFARVGIEWMVVQRAALDLRSGVRKRATTAAELTSRVAEELQSLRQHAATMDESATEAFVADLELVESHIREADSIQTEKIRVLRVLASAGTMWLILVHQLRATLDAVKRMIRDIRAGGHAATKALDRLEAWALLLEAQASELGLLLGRPARQEARDLAIAPVVEQVIATFAGYADDRAISLENAVPAGLRTPPMRVAELHAVLINLVTNALKAVLDVSERRVRIEAQPRNEGVDIRVLDTGVGLRRRDRERAFEPFQTTSSPDPVLGIGTGLGLAIVRDIVAEHGGTVRFVDPIPPWKTEIVIHIPVAI